MKKYILCFISLFFFSNSVFCAITITQLRVVDELRSVRSSFSSTERIGFEVTVNNTVQTSERISFTFAVKDPSGRTVLTQQGNSAPGNLGNIGSSIRNIQLSKFFSVSGSYSVTATVKLAQETVARTESFRVTSPIITLSYPPNNARDLTDKPLTFRWAATGAARYRIYVGNDQSFFNPVHTAETQMLSYSYPMNPVNPIERLVSSQVYYWRVEGLDASGRVISRTNQPYSFTLAQEAAGASTMDVGISEISLSRTTGHPGHVPIDVTIENRGSRPVPPFNLSLMVNGLSIDPPKRVDFIGAGMKQTHTFQYKVINYNEPLVCAAVIDLFDDDPRNNRLVRRIEIPSAQQSANAKIHGMVRDAAGADKKIQGAQIFFSGPKRGFVNADISGVYKIEDLPIGSYMLWARAAGYNESERKTVSVEKEISYTGINFDLSASTAPAAAIPDLRADQFNLLEAWERLKRKLRNSTLSELDGFVPYSVNDRELMESIINDRSTIIRENVE